MDILEGLEAIPLLTGKQQCWIAAYPGPGSNDLLLDRLRLAKQQGWELRPPETVDDELRKHYEIFYHEEIGEGLMWGGLVLMWQDADKVSMPKVPSREEQFNAELAKENEAVDRWMQQRYGADWEVVKDGIDWRIAGVQLSKTTYGDDEDEPSDVCKDS